MGQIQMSSAGTAQSIEGERFSDHLELLAVMGQDFATTFNIEETLRRALGLIVGYLQAEGGALFLLDDDGGRLTCRAGVGPVDITGITVEAGHGIVGRSVARNAPEIVRDVAKDPAFKGAVDQKTGFKTRSILCAPMSVQDKRIGAIEVVNKRGGDGLFAEHDLRMLQALSSSAALAILNARMARALVEQERVRRELELAAEIQRSLLPTAGPEGFPVCGVNRPARLVSGDFYDFFAQGDGRICFTIGDVSGKGMDAALLMAKAASLFHCIGKTILQPGRLLGLINKEICETATRGKFVTMIAGVYDPASGVARFANAGHEPPLFRTRDGGFVSLPAEAPPLGISPDIVPDGAFPECEVALEGGTLYVFTDGVTEGHVAGGGMLGVDGLKEILDANAAAALPVRLGAVISRVTGGDEVHDDLTMLAIDGALALPAAALPPTERLPEGGERLVELTFPARADRLKLARSAVGEAARMCGCSEAVVQDVVLAVDEACQNVIRHAYAGTVGDIVVEARREDGRIAILVRDFAQPIDPDKVKPRDLDDLRPGGLGTYLIQALMDEVDFGTPPQGGGNLLRMVKKIA
jgi:sigma-B regulation protein RsbU (phosphoserine phosphatase)